MKRTTTIYPILFLAVGACEPARLGPEEPSATAPDPQFAAQVETILKGRFPIGPRTAFNDCTGEWADIVGEFNLVVRQVTTPSGKVHFFIHSVGGHVTGVGQTTGMQIVSNEHFNFTQHSGGNGATNLLIEFGIQTVSKGPADNAPGKLQIFMVINANGEMTVDRVLFDFGDCVG